jgi:hypothetical protein
MAKKRSQPKRKAKPQKVRTPTKAAPERKATTKKPPSATSGQIHATLVAYRRAQDDLHARGLDLLAIADSIGTNAVREFRTRLHAQLIEARILDDLTALSQLVEDADGGLPEPFGQFKLLPAAVLQWIDQHLGLRQHLHIGDIFEIPAAELAAFEVAGDASPDLPALVFVRVVRPGWKHDRTVIVPPKVEVSLTTEACPTEL